METKAVEICPDCGLKGQYDGLQLSMIESMGAYSRQTGLRPIGPHRGMADELLTDRFVVCEHCQGRGITYTITETRVTYQDCSHCNGGQYVFNGSQEEFDTLIKKIVNAFPSAPTGAPVGLKPAPWANLHDGYTGGTIIRPEDDSPEAWAATIETILKTTNNKDRRK
jgi:hypothetical protein